MLSYVAPLPLRTAHTRSPTLGATSVARNAQNGLAVFRRSRFSRVARMYVWCSAEQVNAGPAPARRITYDTNTALHGCAASNDALCISASVTFVPMPTL